MINLMLGLYLTYLGIDIVRNEVVRHTLIRAARDGKLLPFITMSAVKVIGSDPFSCIDEIPEAKEKETIN